MVLKSYSKINLSLSVNKKKPNGFHDIQSFFCQINLFDKIDIKKLRNKSSDEIFLSGPFAKYVDKSRNTILKTLNIMRKNKLISNYYAVKIEKNIPVFSGLGGGTGNAATIIMAIYKKKIKRVILNRIIHHVGSDLRLFFYNQGYLSNIKNVIKFKKKYKLNFLIIFPYIKSSTKEVYSKVKRFTNKKNFLSKHAMSKEKFINHIKNASNDLQSIVEKKYPITQKILFNISKQKGCYFSRMTGSGSACYGLFSDEKCSKVALKILKKKYPKFWFSIAKTI